MLLLLRLPQSQNQQDTTRARFSPWKTSVQTPPRRQGSPKPTPLHRWGHGAVSHSLSGSCSPGPEPFPA